MGFHYNFKMGNSCAYSNPKIRASGIIGIYDISRVSRGILSNSSGEISNHVVNESILQFQAKLARNPQDFDANLHLGICLYKQGFYEVAESHLCKSLKIEENFSAYYILGLIFINKSKLQEAIRYLRLSAELNKEFLPACLKLVEVFVKINCVSEAKEYLSRAKSLDKHNSDVAMMLGLYYKATGRLGKAKRHLKRALKNSEDQGKCYFYLGEINHQLCVYGEAVTCYQHALLASKGNFVGTVKLSQALLYFEMENYSMMMCAIEDCLKYGLQLSMLHNYKGFGAAINSEALLLSVKRYTTQQYSEAIKILKPVFRENRSNLFAGYFLAISYKSLSDLTRSEHYFRKVIKYGYLDNSYLAQVVVKKSVLELENNEESNDQWHEDTFECIESPELNKNKIPEFVIKYHNFTPHQESTLKMSSSFTKTIRKKDHQKINSRSVTPPRSVIEKISVSAASNTDGCIIY